MSIDSKIGQLIRAAGKTRSKLAGAYTPAMSDDQQEKTAIEGEPKAESKPMEGFSAEKVIAAVNSAKSLDEALKAYTSASGYTTMDQTPDSSGSK